MHRNAIRVLAFSTFAAILAPSTIAGSIVGSKHDFSAQAWSPGGQICVACHTPHNAATVTGAPLWNHTQSTATYSVYAGSSTLNATVGQPGTVSKLCLSCHDGTVAVDSFGGGAGTGTIAAAANFGTNLSNDHPIGFTFNTALATTDGSLFDPATKSVTIGSGTKTRTGTVDANLLYSGQLECASCHDVHNTYTVATPTGYTSNKLLKLTTNGSAICIACHDK